MIRPRLGQFVLVRNRSGAVDKREPEVAMVCFVHNTRLINIGGWNHVGERFRLTHVQLVQEGDEVPARDCFAYFERALLQPVAQPAAPAVLPAGASNE